MIYRCFAVDLGEKLVWLHMVARLGIFGYFGVDGTANVVNITSRLLLYREHP
jgi:hypothetical protein